MALALPYVLQERGTIHRYNFVYFTEQAQLIVFSRRSLIALASMLKCPQNYRPEVDKMSPGLHLRKTDFLREEESAERSAALKIIDIVIQVLGIEPNSLLTELEETEDDVMTNKEAFVVRFNDWSFDTL